MRTALSKISQTIYWFFTGYSDTNQEKLRYFFKRVVWLGLWFFILYNIVIMIISFCQGMGPTALAALIPIGITLAITFVFRFN